MDSSDRMRVVLGELARRDTNYQLDLNAKAGTDVAFRVAGMSVEDVHKAFGDAFAAGLMSGEWIEGDGSLRLWMQPQLTVGGLAWLGMWPSDERPLRHRRWWDRAEHVLRTLQEIPPANRFLFAPVGTNGPSDELPGADEQTYWLVVMYLLKDGLIRGQPQQGGLADVAVTPKGEAALGGSDGHAVPVFQELTEGQAELFKRLAEIAVSRPNHEREFVTGDEDNRGFITGPPDVRFPALWNDVSKLESAGLVEWTEINALYGYRFVLTKRGYDAYSELLRDSADRFAAVESNITTYLRGDLVASRYPQMYKRWLRAEQQLVSGRVEDLTVVGHTAREALQIFASELVELHRVVGAPDVTKTVARVRSVFDLHRESLGEKRGALLDALLTYWGTVSDLAQRLEHAAQKDGQTISREDARQLVYVTAQVVFEIDQTLPAPPAKVGQVVA